jgi:hypothetical protein
MLELRPLKHRAALSMMVDALYDQLAWREARRAVAEKRRAKKGRK